MMVHLLAVFLILSVFSLASAAGPSGDIDLPEPRFESDVSVESALLQRRTHRRYTDQALTLDQLSQVLWAAYGVTERQGNLAKKTAPSAGALYPLDIYAVIGQNGVEGVDPGVYHYSPYRHAMSPIKEGDVREPLAHAALGQMWMAQAPISVVITGEYRRCGVKYGPRARLYVPIEAGCVGQNIFLQAEALGLSAGIIGAFKNKQVNNELGAPDAHDPLLIMPVGHAQGR